MTTIEAIIERATDGTYSVYCVKEIFSGTGETVEEAKQDMQKQMAFYKETAFSEGFKYPSFLDEEYTMSYSVDPFSLMKYYVESDVFSLAGMGKVTGIHQKQHWSYLNGTKPRKAQEERIKKGFLTLRKELNSFFV